VVSEILAKGCLAAKGIIFLGYILHLLVNKEKLRDAHSYRISCPILFFEGTSDTLYNLDILKVIFERLESRAALEIVEG
jgi:predicted alpha/beta-hydrolase family hydrolase